MYFLPSLSSIKIVSNGGIAITASSSDESNNSNNTCDIRRVCAITFFIVYICTVSLLSSSSIQF